MKLATKELKNLKGKKAVYIVTDGRPDDKYASLQAAKKLKKQGVQIMTLGTDDADQDFLEHISSNKDLSKMTTERELEAKINSMASLLPVDKE